MHVSTIVGLILALASTTLISLAYLREHGAAAGLPALSLKRPLRSAKLLLSSREWLVGFGMETCGFGLYVAALALADGEYVGLLDHDDELTPDALYEVVKLLNERQYDFIYSDEDKRDPSGRRVAPPAAGTGMEPTSKIWDPPGLFKPVQNGTECVETGAKRARMWKAAALPRGRVVRENAGKAEHLTRGRRSRTRD